jgi:hypothetical protein
MSELTTLISALKTINTLKSFVMGGGIEDLFGDIELAASKDALNKAKIAKDPRAQVWLAVSHLESAHRAYLGVYKDKAAWWNPQSVSNRYIEAAYKDRWTMCLMAVCYKFLGESALIDKAIGQAKNEIGDITMVGALMPFPILIIEAFIASNTIQPASVKLTLDDVKELQIRLNECR